MCRAIGSAAGPGFTAQRCSEGKHAVEYLVEQCAGYTRFGSSRPGAQGAVWEERFWLVRMEMLGGCAGIGLRLFSENPGSSQPRGSRSNILRRQRARLRPVPWDCAF